VAMANTYEEGAALIDAGADIVVTSLGLTALLDVLGLNEPIQKLESNRDHKRAFLYPWEYGLQR